MSKIEWTNRTWNPVTGCTPISPACEHCYAKRQAERLHRMGLPKYRNGFKVTLHPELLEQPLHWKKGSMIFVNSMSDTFHKDVPRSFIDQIFDTMEKAPQHTFQILSKRIARMAGYLRIRYSDCYYPKNIWIGFSAWDQESFDNGIVIMSKINTPPVLFCSLEPLLGPVRLMKLTEINCEIKTQREYRLRSSEIRSIRNRRQGPCLEGGRAQGKQIRNSVTQTNQANSGGKRHGSIFTSSLDGEYETHPRTSASDGVVALQRTNRRKSSDQSQEWQQEGQSTGEPGGSDSLGKHTSHDTCLEGRTHREPGWGEQSCLKTNKEASDRNQAEERCRRNVNVNSKRFRDSVSNSVGHLPGQEVEKYINFWIVVGAESGPGARPMEEDWVRQIVDDCEHCDIPVFYKQKIENGKKVSMPLLDGERYAEYPKIWRP